jgi:hypothetical protein
MIFSVADIANQAISKKGKDGRDEERYSQTKSPRKSGLCFCYNPIAIVIPTSSHIADKRKENLPFGRFLAWPKRSDVFV